MRITNTGSSTPRIARARDAGRSDRAREGGFGERVQRAAAAAGGAVAASLPLTSLGAVLAAQEIDDARERQKRALQRGYDLLDELEAIRLGLLEGTLPGSVLRRLEILVAEKRGRTKDPRLDALLDEIELRAKVELAKLERQRRA